MYLLYDWYTKRAITPIDENKYPALLHSLRPS